MIGNGGRRDVTSSLELVLVDFDDTLVATAPRFAAARRALFDLLAAQGFDPAAASSVHHHEVDPGMRERHGFGPQRLGPAFRQTYRVLCERAGRPLDGRIARSCERLGEAVSGTPPVIDGAIEALERLSRVFPTAVYTQAGDVDYQLGCLRDAGALEVVGEARVRVVPLKTAAALRDTLASFGVADPGRACMIGNSIRADVNPALEVGARAILVEIDEPWHLDMAEPLHNGFPRVRRFSEAVDLLLSAPDPASG